MSRPSGTVTFLFTDIEGSTRRWEADPLAMRTALVDHDAVLRAAVEAHGGWLFKHTGDGVCAAFSSARAGVDAAVAAQRRLALPVRMGIATGEVEARDADYFGPALNRAARVMAAGHGGQILVATSSAGLLDGVELIDLGEHRLKDLSGAHRLFQIRAEGLAEEFAALRTLDSVPGNLPVLATSFVGRDVEAKELAEMVRAHQLVTMTGVGGVGKTRLALQVAANLVDDFPAGVWLVELAPAGDPREVPDVVAAALGVTPQAGMSVTESIVQALSGRRLLVVLDNCEHLLDAAADLVEAIVAGAATVKILATSREGMQAGGEHLWPVPSLDLEQGSASAAVELFLERARAVNPAFATSSDDDAAAVTEICARLDGIALAIELAAARMVAMSPQDVRDRLGDRFRLLAGTRRGLERHHTLLQAVRWSYDLLDDDERALLSRCGVFADGFDLAAAVHVNDGLDQYGVLNGLESLVRKSLVTAEPVGGHVRYRLLETIRQFAEEQLAATGSIDEVRDRHAAYYAAEAVEHWRQWDGPGQPRALDWLDIELANLRVGFRRSTEQGDLATATAIAAHAGMAWVLQRFEPIGWAEELLSAATDADVAHLPRLYDTASLCVHVGRPDAAIGYARTAGELEADPRYEPFPNHWSRFCEAVAHLYAGQLEHALEICAELVAQGGPARVYGLCCQTQVLGVLRRPEAAAVAEEALPAARAHGNPYFVAWALFGTGLAHVRSDPDRSLATYREGLAYASEHRLPVWLATIDIAAAAAEAAHGDLARALTLYDEAIVAHHHAGNHPLLAVALTMLALCFDRIGRQDVAATLCGATRDNPTVAVVGELPHLIDHLRAVLGDADFERCMALGASMDPTAAASYAQAQIRAAKDGLGAPEDPHVVPDASGPG